MPIKAAVAVPHPPLMIPAVGKGEERKISKTIEAYRVAMRLVAAQKPQTVVLLSPHTAMYSDYFHISPGGGASGSFAQFGASQVRMEAVYDETLVQSIEKAAKDAGIPAGTLGERDSALDHGAMIPLYFLNEVYKEPYRVVRIGLSGLPLREHYQFGQCIRDACAQADVCVVASGDLSHRLKADGPYGFDAAGPELDRLITAGLSGGEFGKLLDISPSLADAGAECGLRSFVIMAGALDGVAVRAELLSYEGPFGVGYAVATFLPGGADDARRFADAYDRRERDRVKSEMEKEDEYVKLARLSAETYVKTGKKLSLPAGLPDELTGRRAGVFVSLHRFGELRGCIGTIAPAASSVAAEIIQNAVSAATQDPRFSPVRAEELDTLAINVDVLGEPEPVASVRQLDPKRYGVIVSNGLRRGLLLPDLEGVDTAEEQVAIARRKAGIDEDEDVRLERFEVVRHV